MTVDWKKYERWIKIRGCPQCLKPMKPSKKNTATFLCENKECPVIEVRFLYIQYDDSMLHDIRQKKFLKEKEGSRK